MLEILFNEPIRWRNRTIERQRQLAATDRNDESVTVCVCNGCTIIIDTGTRIEPIEPESTCEN